MLFDHRGTVAKETSNELSVKLVIDGPTARVALMSEKHRTVVTLTHDQAASLSRVLMVAAMQAAIHENEARNG